MFSGAWSIKMPEQKVKMARSPSHLMSPYCIEKLPPFKFDESRQNARKIFPMQLQLESRETRDFPTKMDAPAVTDTLVEISFGKQGGGSKASMCT